jgi:acyl carrier protein
MDTTLCRLQEVFRDVFDEENIKITEATNASDVDGWDSLMHVTLMVNVEKAFGLRFSSAEIANVKNVRALMQLVDKRTPKR